MQSKVRIPSFVHVVSDQWTEWAVSEGRGLIELGIPKFIVENPTSFMNFIEDGVVYADGKVVFDVDWMPSANLPKLKDVLEDSRPEGEAVNLGLYVYLCRKLGVPYLEE